MSNEKFTPGEWRVVSSGILGDYNGARILQFTADCFLPYGEPAVLTEEVMQANAHLIEAAPKMYSLLKLARHEFEAVAEWCDEHGMPDDARGYRNLANGILDVLMEIRGE